MRNHSRLSLIVPLALLCAAARPAAADTCLPAIKKLAVGDQAGFTRFLFGLQGNPSRGLLTAPNASSNANLKIALAGMSKSCRSNAYALDFLFRGTETKEADLNKTFSKAGFLKDVDTQISARQNAVFHIRIPKELLLGPTASDTLGHHFLVELGFNGTSPVAIVYMAFEDKFSLADWIKKSGVPAHNGEAGGKELNRKELETWATELEELFTELHKTAVAANPAAYARANVLFTKLFSVSFADMGYPAANGRVTSPATTVKGFYGEFRTDVAHCARVVAEVQKQKAFTCTGFVCG